MYSTKKKKLLEQKFQQSFEQKLQDIIIKFLLEYNKRLVDMMRSGAVFIKLHFLPHLRMLQIS
jgi:hypothetical protein